MEDYVGEPPILLLDDVMSDLDDARREHLLCYIRRRSQTFVTCTNLRAFPDDVMQDARIFRVESGQVTEECASPRAAPAAFAVTEFADLGNVEAQGESGITGARDEE